MNITEEYLRAMLTVIDVARDLMNDEEGATIKSAVISLPGADGNGFTLKYIEGTGQFVVVLL